MVKLVKKTVKKKANPLSSPEFSDIKKWYEKNLHPDTLDLDDESVYDHIYADGNFAGVFQCTAKGAQMFFKGGKPKSITDVAALTSIYRPGPLAAGVDKTYVDAKENPGDVVYEHPLLKECLEPTYGHIIFQEQLMKLGHVVGGLSLDDCDKLRKVITKRSMSGQSKAKEEAKKLEAQFIEGAQKNGFTEDAASEIFEKLAYFSGYGFNKTLYFLEKVYIYNQEGKNETEKFVKDVVRGDYLKSRDEASKNDIFVKVIDKHDHGILELYEFTLDNGETVKCTMDHKFRTTCGKMLPMHTIIKRKLDIVALPVEHHINI